MKLNKSICICLLLITWSCSPKERPFGFKPIYIEQSSLSHFEDIHTLVSVFPANIFGNKNSGYSFESKLEPSISKSISYDVKFSPDFDFVRGGKLPGLCSGKHVSGGKRANGKNGFSSRIVWKKDGEAFVYVYHVNQKADYGDVFGLTSTEGEKIFFEKDVWQKIEMKLVVNSLAKTDGSIQINLNGRPVFEKNDFVFRTDENIKIDLLCFNTFFGGDDSTWAPKKQEKLYVRNLIIVE